MDAEQPSHSPREPESSIRSVAQKHGPAQVESAYKSL